MQNETFLRDSKGQEVSVDELILNLRHPDKFERENAVWSLQDVKEERIIEPLLKTLEDEDPGVRIAGSLVLAHLDDSRAIDPLIRLLDDEDHFVGLAAADALGHLADSREAVRALTHFLKYKDDFTRHIVEIAINRIAIRMPFTE
jgi:bilin biosynthesis protein